MWVKFENNAIVAGPVLEPADDSYIPYQEVNETPPFPGPITVTVDVIDGVCVRTLTAVQDYRAQRAAAYPSLGDQLDMLWHAMDDNATARIEPFYSEIKAIKEQYPKPTPN